ncbi:MAG: tRNA pseudouridine(38-40) synthase TruA [Flavobacteriales bacterium]|nr:tRNA pseudouridine(38-40) synthase TruA [Flavobacteriales bacterium]
MRYFIKLAYDGTAFHGWQMQDDAPSVQQELNEKLSTILQQDIMAMGCGRTDAGVHASEFYAHFDVADVIPMEIPLFIHKLNTMLHRNIAVSEIIPVSSDAHARFDATKRSYQYIISRTKNPFRPDQCYKFNLALDIDRMNKACQLLLGEQDFGCFCKANADNHTNICTVHHAEWKEMNDLITFDITANRFLRNMVRAIVGTVLEIGQGTKEVHELQLIIDSKDRTKAGRSVPAHGLYLTNVQYPSDIFLKNL